MKLAIFANDIVSTKIGGAQKHMREVILMLPDYHDISFFPEPGMYGNSDSIDSHFIQTLEKNNISISPYFLDNYKIKPEIDDILKNYSSEIKHCDLIYDMDFQYYLNNMKYKGEISLRLSKMNNLKIGVCLQDIGDMSASLLNTIKSIGKFSRMSKGTSWFIIISSFFNLLNRKITLRKLLSCNNLSFITIINNEYQKNLKIDFKNTYLLNPSNAIDNTIKKFPKKEKNNHIIFFARLIYQKGLFDVIYIHKKIVESFNIKLIISGKFQREFEKQEFFKLVEHLGLGTFVEYVGILSDEELYKKLSESRLMIYPSHSDSFSISVLQALFLHVPVVAYDIPGLSLYKNFRCISMVKEFDIDSMAEKALNFLNTSENFFDQPELTKFIENHSSWKYVTESHLSAIDFNLKP